MPAALVHLAAGIGNVVLATPLLIALHDLGFSLQVRLDADYAGTAELLDGWSVVSGIDCAAAGAPLPAQGYDHLVPAVPPFYWARFAALYRGRKFVARPPDELFYRNEQAYYLEFARALGFTADPPFYRLAIAPASDRGVTATTVVLAPGCKTGEMAAKRWPGFVALANRLSDVAVAGTADDLVQRDGSRLCFPAHVKMLVNTLSIRETAETLAAAGLVVGNDSGLAHVSAAAGTPTLMLFGPTPDRELGPLPPNVRVLRRGLRCEPCWFHERFAACDGRIDCLRELTVEAVMTAVHQMLTSGRE
jgi:ADP-heptose:LPS heptosyltransferase